MAVAAHDLAPSDLDIPHRERRRSDDERGHVSELRSDVVELEHDWVRLAAIPAPLRPKVGEYMVLQSPPGMRFAAADCLR